MPRLFVVLPAYNEEHSLPPLLAAFERLFARLPARLDPLVIIVNDGSRDGTERVARLAERRGFPLRLVNHARNRGLGEAIKTGLREAAALSASPADILVYMDADNTHPPRYIAPMLRKMKRSGADIVIASRYRRGSRQFGVPPFRQLLSLGALVLFTVFLRLEGVRDYTCGYRAYRMRLVREALEHYGDAIITRAGFACTDQLLVNLACLGARIREVPFVLRYDQKQGRSKIQLGTTIVETLRMLAGARRKLKATGARRTFSSPL